MTCTPLSKRKWKRETQARRVVLPSEHFLLFSRHLLITIRSESMVNTWNAVEQTLHDQERCTAKLRDAIASRVVRPTHSLFLRIPESLVGRGLCPSEPARATHQPRAFAPHRPRGDYGVMFALSPFPLLSLADALGRYEAAQSDPGSGARLPEEAKEDCARSGRESQSRSLVLLLRRS